MHLRLKALEMERPQSPSQTLQGSFDVRRHVALVPPFRESELTHISMRLNTSPLRFSGQKLRVKEHI